LEEEERVSKTYMNRDSRYQGKVLRIIIEYDSY